MGKVFKAAIILLGLSLSFMAVIKTGAIALVVIVITVTLAIFIYPILGKLMLFNDLQFGTWAGLAIHETAQVVAAGFAFSPEAGEVATVVKLTRTVLLAPSVLIVGAIYARKNRGQCGEINYLKIFPWFVIGFLFMAGLRTVGDNLWLNDAIWQTVLSFGKAASKLLIVIAMAAVGLKTSLQTMFDHNGCFEPVDYFSGAHLVKMSAQTFYLN